MSDGKERKQPLAALDNERLFTCDPSACEYIRQGGPESYDKADRDIALVDRYDQNLSKLYWDIREQSDIIHSATEDVASDAVDSQISRKARRKMSKINTKGISQFKSEAKLAAEKRYTELFGNGWDSLPVTTTDIKEMLGFSKIIFHDIEENLEHSESNPDQISVKDTSLYMSYMLAIEAEMVARFTLAILVVDEPQLAFEIFQPDFLEQLAEPTQRIIAADINRGEKGSVVLNHAKKFSSQSDDDYSSRVMDHLSRSDLPKDIRPTFRGIGMGAVSLTGVKCPLNQYGICKTTIDKLKMPDDIASVLDNDMKKRQAEEGRDTVSSLVRFAHKFGKDPLKINVSGYSSEKDRDILNNEKEQQIQETVDILEEVLADSGVELGFEDIPFSKITTIINGVEYSIEPSQGAEAIQGYLQEILQTKFFSKYLKEHNAPDLDGFLQRALKVILLQQGNRSIKAMTDAKPKTINGKVARIHRLSGRDLSGAGGGHIARDTRILFLPVVDGDKRTVIFYNIAQKAEAEKTFSLSRLFRSSAKK